MKLVKRRTDMLMAKKDTEILSGLEKRVFPHLLRHSDAIIRLRKTGNPKALQYHLGHNAPAMTLMQQGVKMKSKYESAMCFCVSNRALFAYNRYWLHKQQMVMQFDRVQAALHEKALCNEWLKEPDISQPDATRLWFHFGGIINKKILAEVHLFFIAIDNVKDMMNVILSEGKLVHLKKKLGSFCNSLEHYTHGRNIFEHYDDRIPGGNRHEKVSEEKGKDGAGVRRNLGGLRENAYIFGGKEWDLSSIEFQRIINGVGSFEKEIHEYLELNQKST